MKKWIGLLLSLVMVLCMVATSFAAPNNANQVHYEGGKLYYDKEGNLVDGDFPGTAVVELSKTVAPTGTENEFEVTLQVRTTQDITELKSDTPDAAVMLILDVSNSMDDCDICGEEKSDGDHSGNKKDHEYISRLAKAKTAAVRFLDDFAKKTGAEGNDKRWVAIVDFGSTAYRRMNWINVADSTGEGLEEAKAIVNSLTVAHSDLNGWNGTENIRDDGGTNVEGALMLADNVWRANDTVMKLNYKYTILLTDGQPTYYVNNNSNSTQVIYGSVTNNGGSSTEKVDVADVGKEAESIRSLGGLSRLYSICYGSVTNGNQTTYVANNTPFGNWSDIKPATTSDMTILEWLKEFSTEAYNGATHNNISLFDTFNSIISQIQLATQAWKVNDEMGEHVTWAGEVANANNNVSNFDPKTNTLHWDVLASNLDGSEKEDNYTILTYIYKYKVKLDNLDNITTDGTAAYTAGDSADTNTEATLTYAVKEEDSELWKQVKPVEFPEPEVKGLKGELSFTKGWFDGETFVKLPGAKFTLTSNDVSAEGRHWTQTATSDENGVVEFKNIPSGHTYTLMETEIPELADGRHFENMPPKRVNVSWGNVVSDIEDGRIVNVTADKTVSLTLKKKFGTNNAYTPAEIVLKITNPDAIVGDVELTEANNWTVTLTGMKPGEYTIFENATVDGYDLVKSATLDGEPIGSSYNNWKVTLEPEEEQSHKKFEVVVTNTYTQQKGKVSVEKTFKEYNHDDLINDEPNPGLENLPEDLLDGMSVEIDLVNEKSKEVYTIELPQNNIWSSGDIELPVGDYTIVETVGAAIKDHHYVGLQISVDGKPITGNKITVTKDAKISLALENHYGHDTGDIRVEKVFDGIEMDEIPVGTKFSVDVYNAKEVEEGKYVKDGDKSVTTIVLEKLTEGDYMVGTSKDLPVGMYYLEERTAEIEGFDHVGKVFSLTDNIVQVRKGDQTSTVTVILTNTFERQTGKLTVKKEFVLPAGVDEAKFDYPDVIYVNVQEGSNTGKTVETLELTKANNWTDSVALPLGTYYLSEVLGVGITGTADVGDYGVTASWTNGGVVVIEAPEDGVDKEYTATVTNTYTRDKGSLTISKEIVGDPDNGENVAVDFVILRQNADGTTSRAVISLPDSDDNNPWSEQIDLPTGTYYLYEYGARYDVENHTLTKVEFKQGDKTTVWYDADKNTDMAAIEGYEFTVEENAQITLAAKNTYTRDTAKLIIKKEFVGLTDEQKKDLSITVSIYNGDSEDPVETVKLTAGNNWRAEVELDTGVEYTLVENLDGAAVEGYNLVARWSDGATVTLEKGNDTTKTLTNTYTKQEGKVSVQKIFEGVLPEDRALLDKTELTVKITVNGQDETIKLSKDTNWRGEITLPVGTYTISEESIVVDGYTHESFAFTGNGVEKNEDDAWVVTVTDNTTVSIRLTNTMKRDTGSLTIEKEFAENSALTGDYFGGRSIAVLVKKDGQLYTTVNLPVRDDATDNVNVWSVTLDNVPTGTYTVEEVTEPGALGSAHVNNHGLTVTYSGNGLVEKDKDNAKLTITNKYTQDVGGLTVHKVFPDDTSKAAEKFIPDSGIAIRLYNSNDELVRTGNVSRQNGGLVTFGSLPVGTYYLVEETGENAPGTAHVDGYTLTPTWTGGKGMAEKGYEVEVTKDTTVALEVSNTYVGTTGNLTIKKIFDPTSALKEEYFADKQIDFVVTHPDQTTETITLPTVDAATGNKSWSVTLTDLPVGTYTVEEVTAADAANTAHVAEYSLAVDYTTNGTVAVTNAATAVMAVTNKYTYAPTTGSLTIRKAFAQGSALNDNTITSIAVNVMQGGRIIIPVQLTKAENWEKTISLPAGTYTVEEVNAAQPGYSLSVTYNGNVTGNVTVTNGQTATMGIINDYTYVPTTGSLVIKKEFQGDPYLYPASVEFTVTGNGMSYKVTVSAQNGWTATLNGLYPGEYTVTEALVSGYDYDLTTAWSSAGGKIYVYPGMSAVITCTNTYTPKDTVSFRIPVEKTVRQAGSKAPQGPMQFSFGASWQGGNGVTVRFENDPANVLGAFQQTSANTYAATLNAAGTVKGYIVIEGYADQLAGFTMQTWENLTGFADEVAAEAAGWTFDKTAVDGTVNWNIQVGDTGQAGLGVSVARTDSGAAGKVSFENVYTSPVEVPETGDGENPALLIALCGVSALGVALLMLVHKRKACAAGR